MDHTHCEIDVRKSGLLKGVLLGALLILLAACQATTAQKKPPLDEEDRIIQQTILQNSREAESNNEYEKAAIGYGRLLQLHMDNPNFAIGYLRNMRYGGNADIAVDAFEQNALALSQDTDVKFEYAKALLAAGRQGDAVSTIQDVARDRPNDWKVYSALGVAYDSLERFDEAQRSYDKALSLSPNNAVVLNNLAMSQAMVGRLSEAISTLTKAAERDRTNTNIRQNLALLYAVDGDIERARALAGMDLELDDLEANMTFYRRFTGSGQ